MIFMMNTLLFCLVYWGLCIVVAPNDDAKIRRWECGLRIWTKIFYIFFLRELSYNYPLIIVLHYSILPHGALVFSPQVVGQLGQLGQLGQFKIEVCKVKSKILYLYINI